MGLGGAQTGHSRARGRRLARGRHGESQAELGLVLVRSAAEYRSLVDASEARGQRLDTRLGVDTLSLSFAGAEGLPAVIRREIDELGWDLARFDVYPLPLHASPGGQVRLAMDHGSRIVVVSARDPTVSMPALGGLAVVLVPAAEQLFRLEHGDSSSPEVAQWTCDKENLRLPRPAHDPE